MFDQKMSAAVDGCLGAIAAKVEGRQTTGLTEFIESLRATRGWSDSEIIEVKSHVARSLDATVKSMVYPATKALQRARLSQHAA